MADRLTGIVGVEDNVARLAEDEYTVLLAPEYTQQQALEIATHVAKKMQIVRCAM
ncbi:MAG: hypothetical protein L3J75_12335 [Methylococcaceae bacterium]|nr:hypothetical protein [Methylococcaceae bacterium]